MTAAAPTPSAPLPAVLPTLRAELQFLEGPRDHHGRASLQIVDPVRNAYFRLAHPAASALRMWRAEAPAAFRARVASERGVAIDEAQLAELVAFLHRNELTTADRQASWREIAASAARREGLLTRLAHSYLFFRIPLIDPDRLLDRVAPAFGFLDSRGFRIGFAAMVVMAAWLIGQRFEAFTANVAASLTLDRLALYAVMLFGLKVVHEFGHAIVAKRAGCRVPTMGVAVMLGVPVLYTDTTDTWRLTDRRRRLGVVLAGVGAEMLVAGVALFAWSFLPEGAPRQIACALATLSVVTSLTLNLNPCMRYDGYFALSDLLDVPNLQERGFTLAREHLRHVLLGLPRPAVEDMAAAKVPVVIGWAYLTWVYRLGLYLGIAALVYAAAFKVLGLVLLAFEVAWFLVRPLWLEGRVWWQMRGEIAPRPRARATAIAAVVVVAASALPWNRVVEAPAVRVARAEASLHARMPARVVEVAVVDGAEVAAGQIVARLEAPSIAAQRRRTLAEIAALEARLARAPALDGEREAIPVIASQLETARERLGGLDRLDGDLVVRAPIDGVVVDLDPGLGAGVWIGPGQEIGRIVAPQGTAVRALVERTEAARLGEGATAVFVPEAGTGARTTLRVVAIGEANERRIADAILADVAGGPVATVEDPDGPTPRAALVAVTLESGAGAPAFVERGTVRIAAAGESPIAAAGRRIVRVLARESGF